MQTVKPAAVFDCLARETAILGPHFLEASAGTGKTFAVEHIVARLLLDDNAKIELEQILAVTFTRAAARELKLRIRSNLQRILDGARWDYTESDSKIGQWQGDAPNLSQAKPTPGPQKNAAFFWDRPLQLNLYKLSDAGGLKGGGCSTQPEPNFESRAVYLEGVPLTRLADALAAFDRCQIFTIHGFCHRMLREFSFELGIAPLQSERLWGSSPKREAALRDFFEFTLTAEIVSVKQLDIVLASVGGVEELANKLKKAEAFAPPKLWADRFQEFRAAVSRGPAIALDPLKEDFASLRVNYKKINGDLEGQVEAIAGALREIDNPLFFDQLIEQRGSLFEFLDPQNKKVKAKDPMHLHYPGFFDWARSDLWPLIQSASDPNEIFATIAAVFKPIDRKILREEGILSPDELLLTMQRALESESFRNKLQKKYRAVLIDEFQDTDPVQWDIFQRLFLEHAEALYLIGDPKQSIYRFRKADLYTYLKAKEAIPTEGHFYLDTNFRSSRPLVDTLNGLFNRDFLHLPQEKKVLPYLPVKAGLDLSTTFDDQKGAVHCVIFEREGKGEIYRYVAREIQKISSSLSDLAILVKDRYEAIEMQRVLKAIGIPSTLKSQNPLCQTLAFQAIVELFEALQNPRDIGKTKIVLAGPFGGYSAHQLLSLENFSFGALRAVLDEKGLACMFRSFFQMHMGNALVQERMVAQGGQFYSDTHQILEVLFKWEQSVSFSLSALARFFCHWEQSTDDAIVQRTEEGVHGVQIMTMHASKGLEFDIVFALGLGMRTSTSDEEAEAEKQRLLYVAMTRAKRRVYVPIPIESKQAAPGTSSPIERFCGSLSANGSWQQELERLSQQAHLTMERVDSAISLVQEHVESDALTPVPLFKIPPYQTSYILSFTALTRDIPPQKMDALPEGHFPRGAEIGIIIHRIFERIFSAGNIHCIVEEELLHGPFYIWREKILEAVQASLDLPLPMGFCLRDIDPTLARVEIEFFFEENPDYFKGLIDLLFMHEGRIYFVDWKTNWLGSSPSDYAPEHLQKTLALHRYDLQASIYMEALARSMQGASFGGAIYLFVRGPSALCFEPERFSLCLNK